MIPTANERQAAINAYGTGNTKAREASRVLSKVIPSSLRNNPAFVLMQYFGYLRRDPDDLPNTNFVVTTSGAR